MNFRKVIKSEYIGGLPCAMALQSCDIGKATLDNGSDVLITWGRNLDGEQAMWYALKTAFQPVEIADGKAYELILPGDKAKKLVDLILA
jgi:hypothetical protein